MLLSVVVGLEAERDEDLPPSLGRAAHGIFLDLVRGADPGLAAALHDEDGPRPFTAAFLEEGATRGDARTVVRPGRPCHLRFTSLDARLSALLTERILPELPERVRLDRAELRVRGVAEGHPWAGRAEYAALARPWLLGPGPPPARIELAFESPTTFRSRGRHVPLPLPELVFGSLAARWNAFAPVRLDDGLRGAAGELLAISRYRLETRWTTLGGGSQVGFVGLCEYQVVRPDAELARQAALLAEYAFFAGVGHKTTMGLGRTRRRMLVRARPPAWEAPGRRREPSVPPAFPRGSRTNHFP